ncbi:sugar phosphate isomerase/epimerase family protein [Enterovirga rhinocerotis]|uniref:Sugar phosphate isomerase/epimerase n=1 Tax=Enterovirga rhinocerotis TaxID=1339210 RepID=A0A4R7BMR6_9HYPH|nr:sugar phosphate isomerase/epimerase family protein [Enterovirga rhinocerotis]TDR85217.1 sugar phosphate isomerase/epimerase [Enterovirga rhinocerotis]
MSAAAPDLSRFAVNQITTRDWTLAQAVDGYARAGVAGIGAWVQYVDDAGIAAASRMIRDAGLFVPCLCTTAWVNLTDPVVYRAALDENRRRLDMAAELGARTLVVVPGGLAAGERDLASARARVADALGELLPHARSAGIALGLEPLHPMYAADRSCLSTFAHCLSLCETLGEGTGIVADVYHSWWDPDFVSGLERAGPDRILTFHLCDWLVPTRDLYQDRGMVGDGIIDIAGYRAVLDRIGYDGPFEIEIFSKLDWWLRDGHETTRIAVERCAPFVGARARAKAA